MPILIKNPKWSQTIDHLHLRIPLKVSGNAANVDIFTHEDFIKINYAPYYFEAFLAHPIVSDESRCKIYEHEVRFTFKKSPPAQMWATFEREPVGGGGGEMVTVKEEIIERAQAKAQCDDKKRAEQQAQIKRDAVSREVERQTQTRETIERLERLAFDTEMRAIDEKIEKALKPPPPPSKPVPPPVPAIRARGEIGFQFSERKFPTPMRESQAPAEQEWLHQQHLARQSIGLDFV